MLAVVAIAFVLCVLAVMRQEFIGDGLRHLPAAIASERPSMGTTRWFLFPALAWLVIHPLTAIGLITGIEPAIRVLLALSVVSGIVYLWSLHVWLRAEGCGPRARAAALMMAGATMPFLALYSDIAEVQFPAALAISALAMCRARFAAGQSGDRTILATVGAIAVASLLYQAVVLSLLFMPLVAPPERLRRKPVLLGTGAIAMCVPLTMIAARLAAGDALDMAVLTTFNGERGELVRASLVNATPLKWAAALVAGPPQAIVGLWKFQGLPLLAHGALAGEADAMTNIGRLTIGLAIAGGLAFAVLHTKDWRLGVAAMGIVALPLIRNQQYTNVKFYLLWPVVVALASTKLTPRHIAAAGVILTLNALLLVRHVEEGRHRYADVRNAYLRAAPADCFFTTDWGAPFWHSWPGSNAALISIFWASDEQGAEEDRITPALTNCFCQSAHVWTDTTAAAAPDVMRLTDHFGYTAVPVVDFLFRPEDGSAVGSTRTPIFMYSADRQAELCAIASR